MRTVTQQRVAVLTLVIVPLLGTLAAMVLLWQRYVFWTDLALLGVLYTLCALGVTIGFHRMLTHQGFKAPEWLRGLFLILGVMAFEGTPLVWTATHIKHHAHSDEDGDPHSPLHGFWHAHMGWLLRPSNFASAKVYAPELLTDKTALFVERYALVWMLIALLVPLAIGGWTGLLWGGAVRIFLNTHVTWSVNSVCHTFGKRSFETTDESRNEWIVGLLALGEGWHNNHHAFPQNAFHGMRWWQFDLSGTVIRLLERAGLVWDVQRVSPEVEAAQREHALKNREIALALRQQIMDALAAAEAQLSSSFWAAVSPTTASLWNMKTQAEGRIAELQHSLALSTNLKKQRLQLWQKEMQTMLANLQAIVSRESAL